MKTQTKQIGTRKLCFPVQQKVVVVYESSIVVNVPDDITDEEIELMQHCEMAFQFVIDCQGGWEFIEEESEDFWVSDPEECSDDEDAVLVFERAEDGSLVTTSSVLG